MSLETWKAEFYPVKADRVSSGEAVAHSLRKWEGLRPETLAEHGIEKVSGRRLEDRAGDSFLVNVTTCALCRHYLEPFDGKACAACPLTKTLGYPCDRSPKAPYRRWLETGDPEPMVAALKRAAEAQPL